jgi:hypothetical protein
MLSCCTKRGYFLHSSLVQVLFIQDPIHCGPLNPYITAERPAQPATTQAQTP